MSSFQPPTTGRIQRVAANEETTILTPVTDGSGALDRLPVSVRKRWIVVSAVLAGLLLASIAFTVYLWDVTSKWQAQVEDVKSQNFELGNELAAQQATSEDLQAQLDLVSGQLDSAQQRVLELADEAAQRGDSTEYYATALADLGDLLAASTAVSSTLVRCVEAQDDLVGYLKNSADYTPAQLTSFESQVNDVCDNAVAAQVELQELLASQ